MSGPGVLINGPDSAARIDMRLDSRSISFENPDGRRGAGGMSHGGRKGAAYRIIKAGDSVDLADIQGTGQIRHIWMTFMRDEPKRLRALLLEVFYDDLAEPSISVPVLDFFGLANGRPAPYQSALTSAQEGRGFNAYFPMPFSGRVRLQFRNLSSRPIQLYYQIDYTLGDDIDGLGFLHATFRRESPTTPQRDFVIAEGLKGPGRFLGCVVGIRVLKDGMLWYGEGEVKVYRDGDGEYPTICGTGLEDYVGTAYGMGQHHALYQGVPRVVRDRGTLLKIAGAGLRYLLRRLYTLDFFLPRFVSFYRWHLPDPIIFKESLRVTIQQIGSVIVFKGQEYAVEKLDRMLQITGEGWVPSAEGMPTHAFALAERSDDYCATAFVYCTRPQAVPRVDVQQAVADLRRVRGEKSPMREAMEAFGS